MSTAVGLCSLATSTRRDAVFAIEHHDDGRPEPYRTAFDTAGSVRFWASWLLARRTATKASKLTAARVVAAFRVADRSRVGASSGMLAPCLRCA